MATRKRTRGRPRGTATGNRGVVISFRVRPAVADALRLAAARGQSVHDLAREVVEGWAQAESSRRTSESLAP